MWKKGRITSGIHGTNGYRRLLTSSGAALLLSFAVAAHASQYRILHSFDSSDGLFPGGTLVLDAAGNAYGTAGGGAFGSGEIFRMAPDGTIDIVYSFTGGSDGDEPLAGLTIDRKTGDLFGTTWDGGASNDGVAFKLSSTGQETVLHDFSGTTDGQNLQAGLVRDSAGNLYGVASFGGGRGGGTIFRIGSDGKFKLLHTFKHSDGLNPYSRMKLDPAGNLYGTTLGGGLDDAGTVFRLAPDGTYTVLHYFDPRNGDGQNPVGGLARDAAGNIYGTTDGSGGSSSGGVVFQLAPDGTETILHRFANGRDGFFPEGDLRRTRSGFLYGTAKDGGEFGGGIVFRIGPDGHENILHSFGAEGDGGLPIPGLTPGPDHGFYGVAEAGGANNLGAIFWIHN